MTSNGVLESWSIGVFNTPSLHYSITPAQPFSTASGCLSLLGNDNPGVVAMRPQKLAVKPAEIGGVVSQQHATLSCRPLELLLIADFGQARLTGCRHVHATISQSANQRVGLRVLIQMEAKLAHTVAVCAGALANDSRSSVR